MTDSYNLENSFLAGKEVQNIYQMYVANGNKVGFWVKRNSWSSQTALITSIGGIKEGKLSGVSPYYGNPKVKGLMEGVGNEVEIASAGTYGYTKIEK